jgi:hypothetical protein
VLFPYAVRFHILVMIKTLCILPDFRGRNDLAVWTDRGADAGWEFAGQITKSWIFHGKKKSWSVRNAA